MKQLSLLEQAMLSPNLPRLHKNARRRWEYAFQKWSDNHGVDSATIVDYTLDYGCCGYGSMCDWCTDNSYGKPCVRALNAMCREKRIKIDYSKRDFEKIWRGEI